MHIDIQTICFGGKKMNDYIEERVMKLAHHIIENKSTVRSTAKIFNISKSTVHKDITQTLQTVDGNLYKEVKEILEINKKERHIRGGEATRAKYIQKAASKTHLI